MEIQINLSKKSRRINRFWNLVEQLNSAETVRDIKLANGYGFNPRLSRKTGQLRGYTCRDCGKEYFRLGWVMRHYHK